MQTHYLPIFTIILFLAACSQPAPILPGTTVTKPLPIIKQPQKTIQTTKPSSPQQSTKTEPPIYSEPEATISETALPPIPTSTDPPILQIDSGGHLALIRDVAFTPDGRYLVSAGEDKAIRIWNIETSKTIRTIRGQISVGHEGMIYAMALSPNGKWLAVGGSISVSVDNNLEKIAAIRLYDFDSGKLVALFKGHQDVVNALAFSPNSQFLVSGGSDSNAIIWDVQQQQQLHILHSGDINESFDEHGHTDFIYGVAFTTDNQYVITGSLDTTLRLWRVQDGKLMSILMDMMNPISALAISQEHFASGSLHGRIKLRKNNQWDDPWGGKIFYQDNIVGSLSFSPDGDYLVSSPGSGMDNECYVWAIPEGKKIVTYKGHDNIVPATAISPDGRMVATGGGNNQEIHLWSLRDGKLHKRLTGVGVSTWAVGFSKDGKTLAWGKTREISNSTQLLGPLEYSIMLPVSKAKALDSNSKAKALDSKPDALESKALALEPESKALALDSSQTLGVPLPLKGAVKKKDFIRAQDKWHNWSLHLRDTRDILDIHHKNRTVASIKRGFGSGMDHRSYTFTPNGKTIISGGSSGVLAAYNRAGDKLGNYVGHIGDIWAVAVSPDGRLLASGSADQTVRLWNVDSYENLLTLFHGNNGEWVAWTPTGHYTASPNGDEMVGWHINRGVDKAADYVKAAQLREHFYRPDIIDAAIRLRSVDKAIAQTEASFKLARLQYEFPPRFEIVSPRGGSKVETGMVPVVLNIAENSLAIQSFEVYVNDRQVTPQKVRKISPIIKRHQRTLEVPLETGKNRITIRAKNRIGFTSAEVTVHYDGPSQIGTLHLVSIGVSTYPHLPEQDQLKFAAKDAQILHNTLTKQAKKHYQQIKSVVLSDNYGEFPTKDTIETTLQNLTANTEDTTVIFIAGHGVNLDGNYYFLPKDAKQHDNEFDLKSLLPWQTLQKAIAKLQGRRILFVDTCHAGNAFNPRLLKDAADANIVVLSATDANSTAQEIKELGHGVFTYALLEGLKGRADMFPDGGKIKFKELDTYVSSYVAQLTDNRQRTVSQAAYEGFVDFVFIQL